MVGRPFGPDHRAKYERQPTDAQEKVEAELRRADAELRRVRDRCEALEATLAAVARLSMAYVPTPTISKTSHLTKATPSASAWQTATKHRSTAR